MVERVVGDIDEIGRAASGDRWAGRGQDAARRTAW